MDTGIEKEVKEKIIAVINALIPQAKIYLFGSRAHRTYSKWSDIDIALDADAPLPAVDVGEVRDMLAESNIPYKIEVLDFHRDSKDMQESIRKEGILWKS